MKMIKMTTANGEHRLFENYHDFSSYINNIEKKKESMSGVRKWMFIRRPHQTLSSLYYRSPSRKDFFTIKEIEAVEKELGLIEILKGDNENFIQILCTPHLDTEPLKRSWCYEYCKNHDIEISEFVKQ